MRIKMLILDGWFGSKDLGCFHFLDNGENLTWMEAQLQCEKIGGYLAEPSTTK